MPQVEQGGEAFLCVQISGTWKHWVLCSMGGAGTNTQHTVGLETAFLFLKKKRKKNNNRALYDFKACKVRQITKGSQWHNRLFLVPWHSRSHELGADNGTQKQYVDSWSVKNGTVALSVCASYSLIPSCDFRLDVCTTYSKIPVCKVHTICTYRYLPILWERFRSTDEIFFQIFLGAIGCFSCSFV